MMNRKSRAVTATVVSLVSFAGCGPDEGGSGPRLAEPIRSAAQVLATDGQVCLAVQRGAAGGVADVADANLWALSPHWIDSTSTRLTSGSSVSAGLRRGLVRYDLSAVPSGATVLSANLSLYQLYRSTGGTSVSLFRVTAPWSESSVTWSAFNNAFDPAPLGSFTTLTATAGWRTVSITPLAQGWVDGTLPNHGVLLDEIASSYTEYRSSEGSSTSERPKLDLCYTTCDDGIQNGNETGVDCGGPRCPSCCEASAEVCDGVDNDCDGQIDEGLGTISCGVGQCAVTVAACINGAPNACVPGAPSAETCNGLDNDCDGAVDCVGAALWSQRFGDGDSQIGTAIAADAAGNVFAAGEFYGSVGFGGGMLTSAGFRDVFVAKFDAAGNHVWSKRFGDAYASNMSSVAVDSAGDVALVGSFNGSIDFGGGTLWSASNQANVFVAKLNAAGNHVWSRRFGDTYASHVSSVAVDSAGNMVLTGDFYGSINFGGGTLIRTGDTDVFVAKLDAAGNHVWSKSFGNGSWFYASSVVVDSGGNVVLTGYLNGSVDFGGGTLTSAGNVDVFVVKFDAAGNHVWSKRFGDPYGSYATGAAIDGAGNVALAGFFGGSVDFGGGPLTSTSNSDIFVVKLDAAGNHMWSKRFGNAYGSSSSSRVAMDNAGNVALTACFSGSVDFGGGPLTSTGGSDGFVAKFDPAGNHLWSKGFSDANGSNSDSYPRGVVMDGAGDIVLTGSFNGAVDFGNGPLTSTTGSTDIFVAKFTP